MAVPALTSRASTGVADHFEANDAFAPRKFEGEHMAGDITDCATLDELELRQMWPLAQRTRL